MSLFVIAILVLNFIIKLRFPTTKSIEQVFSEKCQAIAYALSSLLDAQIAEFGKCTLESVCLKCYCAQNNGRDGVLSGDRA